MYVSTCGSTTTGKYDFYKRNSGASFIDDDKKRQKKITTYSYTTTVKKELIKNKTNTKQQKSPEIYE